MAREFEAEPLELVERPVACDLDVFSASETIRHRELLALLRAAVEERRELPDGWTFRLSDGPGTAIAVAEWITLERRCCGFFTFTLEFNAAGDLWLSLTGRDGAKAILAGAFASRPGPHGAD